MGLSGAGGCSPAPPGFTRLTQRPGPSKSPLGEDTALVVVTDCARLLLQHHAWATLTVAITLDRNREDTARLLIGDAPRVGALLEGRTVPLHDARVLADRLTPDLLEQEPADQAERFTVLGYGDL